MMAIAVPLAVVLAAIAALHAFWALGGVLPGHDEQSQARAFVGARDIKRMPAKSSAAMVALLLFAASLFPLMWTALIPYPVPQMLVWLGMVVLTAVFLLRGLAGYTSAFRAIFPEEPFASLDRTYFSPLCLLLGSAFATLLYLGAYA